MPRETAATRRVRAAIDERHVIKELRTPRHTSLVMRPARGGGGRGNPSGMVLVKDGQITACCEWERQTGAQLFKPDVWVTDAYHVGNASWIDILGRAAVDCPRGSAARRW